MAAGSSRVWASKASPLMTVSPIRQCHLGLRAAGREQLHGQGQRHPDPQRPQSHEHDEQGTQAAGGEGGLLGDRGRTLALLEQRGDVAGSPARTT
jgi:hypothetical protein